MNIGATFDAMRSIKLTILDDGDAGTVWFDDISKTVVESEANIVSGSPFPLRLFLISVFFVSFHL